MNLVTGATGLLGSHVLVELAKRNQKIRATYRSKEKINAVNSLFQFYFKDQATQRWGQIEWVEADLLDLEDLKNLVIGCDSVYHCAALVSFFKADFEACIKQNRYVTANLVDLCVLNEIKHFCHVSSTAAIGAKGLEINEDSKWQEGGSHSGYGLSKRMAEREVWRAIEEGLKAVIVNPCVILGPAAKGSPSLQILETAKKGLLFHTAGSNCVVDARDVAWVMAELVEKNIIKERFLVVGPHQSFKELFSSLAKKLNSKAPRYKAPRALAMFVATIHEFWCRFSKKRSGLSIETVRSSYEVLGYSRNKIETSLSFKYRELNNIIENMISGQQFIEKTIHK